MRGAVVLAAWAAALPALAATQTDVVPSVTFAAGADDNVLFDGRGGDAVARGGVGLRLKAWDRVWKADADLRMSGLAFNTRQRFVGIGEARASFEQRLSPTSRVRFFGRGRAADDPLALAQTGLLAVSGQVLGWRTGAELVSRRTQSRTFEADLTYDGVEFFDPSVSARGGSALGLRFMDRERLLPRLSFTGAVETRAYFGAAEAQAVSLLPGVAYRPWRRTWLELEAGPLAYVDDVGVSLRLVGRGRAVVEGRGWGTTLTLSHDLSVPTSRGGVMVADIAELVARMGEHDWEVRGRAGYYRSQPNPHDARIQPGYGLEASAFRQLVPGVWLGLSAMRFERLQTAFAPALARDAVYLRLDFTGGRP